MTAISFNLSCRFIGGNVDAEYKRDCTFCPGKGYIAVLSDILVHIVSDTVEYDSHAAIIKY